MKAPCGTVIVRFLNQERPLIGQEQPAVWAELPAHICHVESSSHPDISAGERVIVAETDWTAKWEHQGIEYATIDIADLVAKVED